MEIAPIIFNNNKNLQKVMENDITFVGELHMFIMHISSNDGCKSFLRIHRNSTKFFILIHSYVWSEHNKS